MPRITPRQLDVFSSQTADLYQALEMSVFEQIAKRLKFKGNEDILEWQARAMSDLGLINDYTIKELSSVTGRAVSEIESMFEEVGYKSIGDIDNHLKEVGIKPRPLPTNTDNIMRAYQQQMFVNLDNYVNQSLITTAFGKGELQKMYEQILNEVTAEFTTGLLTRDEALSKVMDRFAVKGLPSSYITANGINWSVDSYVRNVLKSTLNSVYNQLRTERMSDYGIHTVLMTSLSNPAPRCSNCQGRVLDMRRVSLSQYPSIYDFDYGLAGGTLGANCRHDIIPYIEGASTNNQPKFNAEEAKKEYEATQKQRAYERSIRKTKKRLNVAEALDGKDVDRLKTLLKAQQKRMRELIKDNEFLSRDYAREKIYT